MSEPDTIGKIKSAEYNAERGVIEFDFVTETGVESATMGRNPLPNTEMTDGAMEQMAEQMVGKPVKDYRFTDKEINQEQ